ncbi:MAG: TonB family protein [Myxococcota bacterium]|nr:TonB family protein [Myxococcota bacterium]
MRSADAVEVVLRWDGAYVDAWLVRDGETLRVGTGTEGRGVPIPSHEPFELLEREGSRCYARVPEGARARIESDAAAEGAENGRGESSVGWCASGGRVPLAEGMRVVVELGALELAIRPVRLVRPRRGALDARPWLAIAASAAVHAAFVIALHLAPPRAGALTLTGEEAARFAIRYVRTVPEWHAPARAAADEVLETREAHGGDPAGQAGSPAVTERRGGGRARPASQSSLRLDDPDGVRSFGVLGVLGRAAGALGDGSAFTAESALRSEVYGPHGLPPGLGAGSGGLDMLGYGRGSCDGWCVAGSVALQPSGMAGVSSGTCTDETFRALVRERGHAAAVVACAGDERGHMLARVARQPRGGPVLRPAEADVIGGLTREQVRRVVARNRAQVAHCYEQRLQARPDLQGRVTIAFVVGPDGAVGSAVVAANDTRDATLGACVAEAVRRWPFPAATGVTAVTYPFVFHSASSNG